MIITASKMAPSTLSLVLLSLLGSSFVTAQTYLNSQDCNCGFYDPSTNLVFTDSSIVYFNETSTLPSGDLIPQSFAHSYDKGWNNLYRQGAAVENIEFGLDATARNTSGLALYCDPSDNRGLVVGASMRTARQDIFFGSFRAMMRAPRPWLHGSALSMLLQHNETEKWDIDVMNTDNSSYAWVSMLANGVFSDTWLGTNFTNLTAEGLDPWYYTEYRVDWTRDFINYYIGGILQKSYTTAINGTLPSTPAPVQWQHWSLGNEYNTQGPPGERAPANLQWTRIFFNSSLTTQAEHDAYDQNCTTAPKCVMDDYLLRNSTSYPPAALEPWEQYQPPYHVRWAPLIVDIAFAIIVIVLTSKTLWRRFTMEKLYKFLGMSKEKPASSASSTAESEGDRSTTDASLHSSTDLDGNTDSSRSGSIRRGTSFSTLPPTYSGSHTPAPQYSSPTGSPGPSRLNSIVDMARNSTQSEAQMSGANTSAARYRQSRTPSKPFLLGNDTAPPSPRLEANDPTINVIDVTASTPSLVRNMPAVVASEQVKLEAEKQQVSGTDIIKKPEVEPSTALAGATPAKPTTAAAPRARIDYLAGFIAMSAVLVTFNHFCLTFVESVIDPAARPHYPSETIARNTFATYFLDPLWIGPFLMISTRFLISNYLRTGKLDNMAQKIVARPFRLLTPVASIFLLEYFLMDAGALHWLEYLPSVTWSSWPFTTIVQNPGVWLSEVIQLAYLIPNAAPNITYNYCTGVLWTIPVQLQGAWQTLLALIMIVECKTPWKRFAFYSFCIANHWYGLSWGSYYYAGVLLADLDINFKYKKWLAARWWAYYPLLFMLIAAALGGFTIDLVTQHTGVNYAEVEYGWHPDVQTGLTISQSGKGAYPDYFIPRLNALITTVSMQMIVEICPTVQKVLSVKVLQWLFPHVFTIYLIHGFIFWSVGSWAMVSIFSYGCPYWLCVLLTWIICYFVLFACLPLLTPPIEMVGKNFTMSLWEHASQEPVKRKPTTFPFGTELFLGRNVDGSQSVSEDSLDDEKPRFDEKVSPVDHVTSIDDEKRPYVSADEKRPYVSASEEKGKGRVIETIKEG